MSTPTGVKELEEKNLAAHMYGRSNTFHSENEITNPFTELDENGKRLRCQIAEGSGEEWRQYTPVETHAFLEEGKCKRTPQQKADYGDIFTSPIPFSLFTDYLNSKSKNKAPSVSEVRLDHVASADETDRKLICEVLSLPYVVKRTFSSWDDEIITWIPKEPGNPDMKRRRPIALLEVLRKLAVGVKKTQVFATVKQSRLF